jgi:hypothetical protein
MPGRPIDSGDLVSFTLPTASSVPLVNLMPAYSSQSSGFRKALVGIGLREAGGGSRKRVASGGCYDEICDQLRAPLARDPGRTQFLSWPGSERLDP